MKNNEDIFITTACENKLVNFIKWIFDSRNGVNKHKVEINEIMFNGHKMKIGCVDFECEDDRNYTFKYEKFQPTFI